MSHHYSGPNIGFPRGDARLDLTDLYAFPSPQDPGKSILIMNVHPSAAIKPPGPATEEAFAPEAIYELIIETDGQGSSDYRFFAGWRSDPFFFDVLGTLNNFQFTGDDFFIDKDICSIVLELPNSILGPGPVRVWARTLIPANVGGWVQ